MSMLMLMSGSEVNTGGGQSGKRQRDRAAVRTGDGEVRVRERVEHM